MILYDVHYKNGYRKLVYISMVLCLWVDENLNFADDQARHF